MFITRDDLNKNLYAEIIDAITRLDETREEYGIRTAEEKVKSYLAGKYDLDFIFSKTGDDRNFMIVDTVANIALYIIADVLEQMPVTIQNAYENSTEYLKDLQAGKAILPNVPEPTNPETGEPDAYIRYGQPDNRY
jgi:phage gp36-like protein